MEKNLMMLVNPAAGRSMNSPALGTVVSRLCQNGFQPTVYYTTHAGAARELTREHAMRYDRMLCLGGDGTLSDVIAGLMDLPEEERPPLGYIPMGTANDVATTLGLPMRQPAKGVAQYLQGAPLPYDVGEMDSVGYFTYIAAFGAFTAVSYKTDQELKHMLGHAAYVLEGLNSLTSIKSYHARVTHDDGELEGDFIYGALSNALSVGGMVKMDRKLVNLSDGKFELLLVHRPATPGDTAAIISGILAQDYSGSCLTVIQSSRVRFEFDEAVPWTRDGEDGGEHKALELRCHPRAVSIIC